MLAQRCLIPCMSATLKELPTSSLSSLSGRRKLSPGFGSSPGVVPTGRQGGPETGLPRALGAVFPWQLLHNKFAGLNGGRTPTHFCTNFCTSGGLEGPARVLLAEGRGCVCLVSRGQQPVRTRASLQDELDWVRTTAVPAAGWWFRPGLRAKT